MRGLLTMMALAIALGLSSATAQAIDHPTSKKVQKKETCIQIHQGINFYRKATRRWEDAFEIGHIKSSKAAIHSCVYATWVAKLWRKRAWRLRDDWRMYESANRDFKRSAFLAHRIFPSITVERLWNRANAEGGHGGWVWNNRGSGAGGWFQFMEGTYYGRSDEAFSAARRAGFTIPRKFNSFYSVLGQNVTAAYMFTIGLECSGEGWAASC